jgi:hypothetical protein
LRSCPHPPAFATFPLTGRSNRLRRAGGHQHRRFAEPFAPSAWRSSAGLRLIWVQGAPQIADWQARAGGHTSMSPATSCGTVCVNRWRVPAKQGIVLLQRHHPDYFTRCSAGRGSARHCVHRASRRRTDRLR